MRTFVVPGICAALMSCAGEGEALPAGSSIDCALGGSAAFAQGCTMERHERDGEQLIVVRHPDGVFRRFRIGVPGRGIVTADGVEQAAVERGNGLVEVRVGSDRYRLPVGE